MQNNCFNLLKFCSRRHQDEVQKTSAKRIKDRGIDWREGYPERSESIKKSFEKKVGPRSYTRWEGHDYETDADYYVVVGPAITGDGRKMFFAGIKRLPADKSKKVYAPSGEYFTSLTSAYSHANQKWGVPYPNDVVDYNSDDLKYINIPRHVKS